MLPVIDATITQVTSDGSTIPLDLTTAVSVLFRMRNVNARSSGVFKINAAAAIVSAAAGTVRYTPVAGDFDTPGQYAGEFVITFPGAKTQTVPTTGYIAIVINDAGLPG